jgi:hypothetical protein
MQDMLYKDFHLREEERKKIEEELKLATRQAREAFLAEERKVKKYEQALDAATKGASSDSDKTRMVEMTKQNTILEVNLHQKTREFLALKEQEERLMRNYQNVEMEMSEMEVGCLKRINDLKKWKRMATFQLKELYEQLRVAVPLAEYEGVSQELELFKTKNGDLFVRNAELAEKISKLQEKVRSVQTQADESRQIQDQKDRLASEFKSIRKRLERYDPTYARENRLFERMAKSLKSRKVSIQQAFEAFDDDKDGQLSRPEFELALNEMGLYDLSPENKNDLIRAMDIDGDGKVSL